MIRTPSSDISDRNRLDLLINALTDYAIYMMDKNGVITTWNTGAERLKGYTAREIIGQNFSRFYSEEDRAVGLPSRTLEITAREGRFETEAWRVRKDGTGFWASVVIDAIRDERGELLGFAKITRDVTERKLAEEAQRESERQFRLLVANVTDYALFMLSPDGIVTNWNAGAERIKGYKASEIVGQHFSQFYTEKDKAAGIPARALQNAAEKGRFEAEGWRVKKDGSLFWANVIIDPVKDETGSLIGFAKITRDITERRNAQIALEKAQAERGHAQKMEALGQLTGGVAHDFNNLLMIVSGHLRRLDALVGDDPLGARAVEAIATAVQRGSSLTRQLLTFARRQTLKPTNVSLSEQISSFETMLTSSLGSSANLITQIPSDIWPVRIDVSEFELALVNLAFNARDAMPQGGTITITAQNIAASSASELPLGLNGDYVALTIADTGSGIAPDILTKVFDPFFTTKQAKGSGLGLSQVHGFAHQSGGSVRIDSELGLGTRITIFLPRAGEESDQPIKPEMRPEGAAVTGDVLLVEDNPDVKEVTVSLLEQLGYHVQVAESADATLDMLEKHAFDVLVSDIVMAGPMDGLQLARKVRERHRKLPIVLVTGYSQRAATAEPDFIVVRKPYQPGELSHAITKALAEVQRFKPNPIAHDSIA